MRSAKYIGLFAVCGFILSFVSGLFSHSSILSVLLKALIFAVIFGLLGLGIYFIYSKFLSNGSAGDFQGEYSADSSSVPSASAVGQNVDITIQDEELAPSESENHFVVGENHQMLNESDIRNSANGSNDAQNSSQGFVPLRNLETIKNFSGKEAVKPADAVASENTSASGNLDEVSDNANVQEAEISSANGNSDNAGKAIDILPDMENFVFSDNSGSDSDDDSDTGTDSEFVASSGSRKKNEAAEVQDAALMAKAISSVLSDEDS